MVMDACVTILQAQLRSSLKLFQIAAQLVGSDVIDRGQPDFAHRFEFETQGTNASR